MDRLLVVGLVVVIAIGAVMMMPDCSGKKGRSGNDQQGRGPGGLATPGDMSGPDSVIDDSPYPSTMPAVSPPRPATKPEETAEEDQTADTCRTELAGRRNDFLFMCSKCNASFTPTLESARQQTRGAERAEAIDCPLCKARGSAYNAICCPQCQHVYTQRGHEATDRQHAVRCPQCKTDPAEWYLKKRGLK